jgi:hypothetical protein
METDTTDKPNTPASGLHEPTCSPFSLCDDTSEPSSKGQDTTGVIREDSGFDSPAAHLLRALLNAEDKYGYCASMCHPRVRMAHTAARIFLENVERVHPYQRGRSSITGLGL